MKILFFNYEYPPLGGGAANATSYILEEFSRFPGIEVDLVTSSVSNKYELETIGKNINIHRLPIGKNTENLHFQSQKDLLIYSWKAFWFAHKLLLREKYDLSHSFFSVPCGFLSLIFKWRFKLPYIVSLRGSDVPGYSERFRGLYFFLLPIIRMIWRQADQVVANSEGLKELAQKSRPEQEIAIIPNGIAVDTFKPKEGERPSQELVITPGASRVTARKGLNFLLEALSQLSGRNLHPRLKIIGDGNERQNLEKLARKLNLEKQVEFLGLVPHKEVLGHYQTSDIFVLPSLNEGMSNAMLEALAVGLPLVATNTGGTQELVEDGKNGFIIKTADSRDIAEKLEYLIKDDALRKAMGQASRKKALGMSWQKAAENYASLYKRITTSKK